MNKEQVAELMKLVDEACEAKAESAWQDDQGHRADSIKAARDRAQASRAAIEAYALGVGEGEPVGEVMAQPWGDRMLYVQFTKPLCLLGEGKKLYTAPVAPKPQVSEDARDAARYRFLKNMPWLNTPLENVIACQSNARWDEAIDAAMLAAAPSKEAP